MGAKAVYLFNKHFHPANFAFGERAADGRILSGETAFELRIATPATDIYHIEITNPALWPRDDRVEKLASQPGAEAPGRRKVRLEIGADAGMALVACKGRRLLQAAGRHWFGTSGKAWLFRFERLPGMRFYGLGEKHTPFERSGRAYTFWNVDAWADHPAEQILNGDYDPDYISIPYLIIKQGNVYIGLLMDCPHAGLISLADDADLSGFLRTESRYPPSILMGAEDGRPSLYLIFGPSLAGLTRKFQQLVGTTPLPPLWALGYHQSRWGYCGEADLKHLAENFEAHAFPANGLWLDIDYMADYRVFTLDRRRLPRPAETAAELAQRGLRIVPILDPGVKREDGYKVYESGRQQQLFCRNEAGGEFVGLVWPGLTVFPDFSLPETRQWWAGYARRFFSLGFGGAWLDMNDPSTGPVDCHGMRFDHGRADHGAYHNQYALLMARATRDGFMAAHPDRRPFLVSRSGCTGSQRYAAHWLGDNFSSYRHLQRSIGKSLNLALSGIPFNGPDVGGFGGDCGEALLIDWIKAAFLFPLLRNHTMRGSRNQEPWAYSREALRIIRQFVRLRYTLLPYLYNLFIEQEETGEAILRPLQYDFADTQTVPLGDVDDQFMVGPFLMQAPFLTEWQQTRRAMLPSGRWMRADTGRWIEGGRRLVLKRDRHTTPLFVRDGALIPFQPGIRRDNRSNLNDIGLICCLSRSFAGQARCRYRADDGLTTAYRQGQRSEVAIEARILQRQLHLELGTVRDGFGEIRITPYTLDPFAGMVVEQNGTRRELGAIPERMQLSGQPLIWYRWQ
jgi:alpha-glucosidase